MDVARAKVIQCAKNHEAIFEFLISYYILENPYVCVLVVVVGLTTIWFPDTYQQGNSKHDPMYIG